MQNLDGRVEDERAQTTPVVWFVGVLRIAVARTLEVTNQDFGRFQRHPVNNHVLRDVPVHGDSDLQFIASHDERELIVGFAR